MENGIYQPSRDLGFYARKISNAKKKLDNQKPQFGNCLRQPLLLMDIAFAV
jgi:hypothetical protein